MAHEQQITCKECGKTFTYVPEPTKVYRSARREGDSTPAGTMRVYLTCPDGHERAYMLSR
jgi:hypothetical protein